MREFLLAATVLGLSLSVFAGDTIVFDEGRLLVERFPSKELVVADNLEWLKAVRIPSYGIGNVIKWLELRGADVVEYKAKYRPVDPPLGLPLLKRPNGRLGYMLDISRDKVPKMKTLKALVDVLAACGFNAFQLYTEHTFAFSRHEVAWKGWSPMTAAEIRELDAYCWSKGLRLLPNQNSFGHLERWFQHKEYLPLAAAPEGFSILHPKVTRPGGCALNPGAATTYAFLSGLYDELLPNFAHADEINVGCDEVWDIFADNARCAVRAKEVGVPTVYMDHLLKVCELVGKRGKRVAFWGDMVLRYPELLDRVPKDANLLQWGYGGGIADPSYVCEFEGRCRTLQRRGISYTVCPSSQTWANGRCAFREARGNIKLASDAGRKYGAEGMLLTEWGDCGHCNPLLASIPAIAYAGLVCRGEPCHEEALANEIDRVLGCKVGKGLVAWGLADQSLDAVDGEGAPDWVANGLEQLKFNRHVLELSESGKSVTDEDVARYRRLWLEVNRPGGLEASVEKFLGADAAAVPSARTHELVERRIAASKAIGGRYVSLEAGEWRFGRPVRLESGFSIRLERGARLVLEEGSDCAFFVFDGVTNGEILGMDSRDMPVMVGSGKSPCVVFRDAVGTHCGARLDNIRFENGTAPAVSLVRSRGWFLMHLRNAVVDVGEECADITIDYPHGIYEEEKLLRKAPDAKNVRVCHLQGVRWRESCPARHRPLIPQPKKYVPKRGRCLMPGPRVEPWMLRRETNATLKSGAYRISVTSDRVLVTASDEDGFFNAFQTLRQISEERPLCRTRDPYCGGETASDLMLPCCEVEDEPAFRWRGVHIDECRHFFGKAAILDALEQMAAYKLNVLHWHLTEDQGWRLAIDAFPKLTERGAIRRATQTRVKNGFCDLDGCTYGPFFYTKEDVREIVAFAAAHRITIVPEIELPGHCRAALAAYPEFACFPEAFPHEPSCVWGVEDDVLCVGNPDAIRFFERVLDEVMELFPGRYVHIGGDECPTVRWRRCPKCRAKAESLGLKPEKLQGWVTAHFAKYLSDRGRSAIGWDEILECDIPADTPVMSWRENSTAPSSGHPVVLCNSRCNYYSCAPQARGSGPARVPDSKRVLDMPAVYAFEPYAGVPEKDRSNVIGAQACFWSETLEDATMLEMNMWPRLLSLAEIMWANPKKDYPEFLERVRQHIDRLADQGVRLGPADLELGSERLEQK